MAYIKTGNNYPGILGLLWYKHSSGKALSNLAQTLLHGPSSLTKAERETIAAYVSYLNECSFCHDSHKAAANCHWNNEAIIEQIIADLSNSALSNKMKALLQIAAKVQKGGKHVLQEDIDVAKRNGANDEEIHDAILVAAAFCMYNRYVDGLGTKPAKKDDYKNMGIRLAKKGYKHPPVMIRWLVKKILNKQFADNPN